MGHRRGKNKKSEKKHRKPRTRVKFAKNVTPPPKVSTKVSPKNILRKAQPQPHTTWENIVLHYLSKLRGFLAPSSCTSKCTVSTRPSTGVNDNQKRGETDFEKAPKHSLEGMTHHPNKYRNIKDANSTICLSDTSEDSILAPKSRQKKKKKALKIVSAAIDYGCAHGIIENKGRYFWLKNTFNRIANRSPTPCVKKQRCKTCKELAQKYSYGHRTSHRQRSATSTPRDSTTVCDVRGKPNLNCSRSSIYKRGSNNDHEDQCKAKRSRSRPESMDRNKISSSLKCNCSLCKNHRSY